MKLKITNKGLYWGLIATFGLLYLLVAFVSTLHAIDFFQLSNIGSLAILLGVAYEVGQASVLFSILMTKNKEKFLPWVLMFLLTALQVTANVYASFKHMSISGNNDWTYWYTSILKIFGVAGGTTETYQVIISWISGALLPIVALGMTALVAQNIKLITEEGDDEEIGEPIDASDLIAEVSRVRPTEDDLEMAEAVLSKKKPEGYFEKEIPLNKPEKAQEEIEKIRKLMDTEPIKNGAISDNIKKILSPGLPLEEDAGDSAREQISREVNDDTHIEPPLDLTQFKSPGVFTREGDPRERGEELPPEDDVPFPVEEPSPPENELQPNEKSEFEKFVDNVLPVDESFSVYDEEDAPVANIEHIEMPTPSERDVEPPLDDNPTEDIKKK